MSRLVENKFMFAVVLFLFVLALACNALQGAPAPVPSQMLLAPDTVNVAIGPTMPPDPWEGVQVAIGPTMPPDPWEGVQVAIGPTMPPDPWEGVQVAIGPTMPPDPWEGISVTA